MRAIPAMQSAAARDADGIVGEIFCEQSRKDAIKSVNEWEEGTASLVFAFQVPAKVEHVRPLKSRIGASSCRRSRAVGGIPLPLLPHALCLDENSQGTRCSARAHFERWSPHVRNHSEKRHPGCQIGRHATRIDREDWQVQRHVQEEASLLASLLRPERS